MSMIESRPNSHVLLKLEFMKPFKATNQTTFTLTPVDGGTRVNWAMEGKKVFITKAFSLLMDMDSMIGKDFEKGLANLDASARAEAVRAGHAPTSV